MNPVDTKLRKPKEKVEPEPRILGWDIAGIVEEIGPDCTLFQPGDEVFYAGSITRQGGNSEIDHKKIKTTVTEVLSPINAENLRKAHATLEAGRTIGKIVLKDF